MRYTNFLKSHNRLGIQSTNLHWLTVSSHKRQAPTYASGSKPWASHGTL